LGATLNWRPVREIEREIEQIKQRSRQNESEAEQLRRENARERALSALIKQHCFPPECNSIPPQQTEIDCGPSSP
jgi:hypothetical protein